MRFGMMLVAFVFLAGCGVKGDLEPPPSAAPPQAQAGSAEKPPPPAKPNKPFILDSLL